MGISNRFKQFVKKGDFFNSYQMLRYEKQTEYRTFVGGLISIAIIVIIIISFANMILSTINRTTINFSESSSRNIDPTLSTITASSDSNFMFGVQVWNYNLTSENRLFDVFFTQIESNYGENYTYVDYPLQACTPQHWSLLPNVVNNFNRLRVGNWLCPTIETVIKLQGKYTSQFYNQFQVTLYPCSNTTNPSKPCASQQQIDQFFIQRGQWNYFTFYFINSIINPDQPQYKSYYLEDRNYVAFGTQMGAQLDMYLNEIEVQTDNSIWPFTNTLSDTIWNIDFNPIYYPFAVNNATSYASFYVMKDPSQIVYKREVQKIFVVFSFMGGLIGAVMATLFIMNSYTSFAYELALALEVFKQNQHSPTHKELKKDQKSTVNLFHYIKYYAYVCLSKCMDIDWSFQRYMEQCRQEIEEQLDIKGLLKRIIFLEYSISYILQDFHLEEMQMSRPITPSQVKQLRLKIQAARSKKDFDEEGIDKDNKFNTEVLSIENSNRVSNLHLKVRQNTNIIFNQMQDRTYREKAKRLSVANKSIHLKKLIESAKEGNIISKKLLNIIRKQDQQSEQVEQLSAINFK